MEGKSEDVIKEKTRRPMRNKKCNRKNFGEEKRPPKRLFTPEIKRYLKEWLIRRRDNPYPNRDEKKALAIQTGLTYIQVCNWFANWRRKLKNSGKNPQTRTWGDLIKTYNNQAHGNVEHFSICSDDSIWEEATTMSSNSKILQDEPNRQYSLSHESILHNALYYPKETFNNNTDFCVKNFQNLSLSPAATFETNNGFVQPCNKYKNHIIGKYINDCNNKIETYEDNNDVINKPSMISKWLQSAKNFKPSENNYIDWNHDRNWKKKNIKTQQNVMIHGKEEMDAAEALTNLANWNRNRR